MKHVVTAARRPRVLVTGFGPFPGAPTNPTVAILADLERERPADVDLMVGLLPVTFAGVADAIRALVARARPDAIVHLGLAGRRRKISVETRASNRAGLARPDCDGLRPTSPLLIPDAPASLAATWPAARILAALEAAGIAARLSRDAGDYVCNATLFRSLLEAPAPRIGFLHVPPARDRTTLDRLTRAARIAIAECARG